MVVEYVLARDSIKSHKKKLSPELDVVAPSELIFGRHEYNFSQFNTYK